MIVGGHPGAAENDAEFIDLSGQFRSCPKPSAPEKLDFGSTGAYFDGAPLVCGGYDRTTDSFQDLCYKYEVTTNYEKAEQTLLKHANDPH